MIPIWWTESARADLRTLRAYIARDSRVHAKRRIDRLKQAVERLRDFPESGVSVAEWDRPELREIVVGSYRVIY